MKAVLKRKNLYIDTGKLKKAQKFLGAKTETEAVDQALDLVAFQKEILQSLEAVGGRGAKHIRALG